MVRISKNKTIYTSKQNVDITNLIQNENIMNTNQIGGGNNTTPKKKIIKSNLKKKYNSENEEEENEEEDDDDDEEVDEEEVEDEEEVIEVEVENNEDVDDAKNDDEDIYSEKSDDKESDIDKESDNDEEENDDEETLKTKCYSKYAKVDYDDLDFDELFGEEPLLIVKNIRISKPILTKYEYVRLLTDRSKQLAQGAKPMLKNIQDLSSKEIAKLELKNKIIPLIIERPVPNSTSERWKLSELEIPEYLFSS
jgi:DNA-directed RNA polymerase subunit K/omega